VECGCRQKSLAAKDSTLCKKRDLKQKPRLKKSDWAIQKHTVHGQSLYQENRSLVCETKDKTRKGITTSNPATVELRLRFEKRCAGNTKAAQEPKFRWLLHVSVQARTVQVHGQAYYGIRAGSGPRSYLEIFVYTMDINLSPVLTSLLQCVCVITFLQPIL
jgi:hypothetical protein